MPRFSSFTARTPPLFSRAITVTNGIIDALVMTFPMTKKKKQKKGTKDNGDNDSDDDDEVHTVSYRERLEQVARNQP